MTKPLPSALLLICTLGASAGPGAAGLDLPGTLDEAMDLAKPESIGTPVLAAWWSVDGRDLYYRHKPPGAKEVATFGVNPRDGSVREIDAKDLERVDEDGGRYNTARTQAVYERDGDIWMRDLDQDAPIRVTRTSEAEAEPRFSADGRQVYFRRGTDWFAWTPEGGLETPWLALRGDNPPPAPPALASAQAPATVPAPEAGVMVYLGPQAEIQTSWLSPSGRHALVTTTPKGYDAGRVAQMPVYVTASGYPEMQAESPRIGRNPKPPTTLWLVDTQARRARVLDLAGLSGISEDPLSDLRSAQGLPPLAGPRPVAIHGVEWSADGGQVAVQVGSRDGRDAWLAGVDLATGAIHQRHRLAGLSVMILPFGFLPDGRLWFQSESGGYSGLYLQNGDRTQTLAAGPFEVGFVQWSPDGQRAYFTCNRRQPGDWEVCRVEADGSGLTEVTALDGVGAQVVLDAFRLSPDGRQLAVRHSGPYLPLQLSLVDADSGATRRITDTQGEGIKARAPGLVQPRILPIPSSHFPGQIWGRLLRPETLEPGRRYPVVLILHGGNVVQAASPRLAGAREAMFANFLVGQGYLVLEPDYRGSIGYGRDFRESVYGRLGFAEVEDLRDAVAYLVAEHQGAGDEVGAYGCSYGGYLGYMAAFLAPDLFKAVTAANGFADWHLSYADNSGKLLDSPELNPAAFLASSATTQAHQLAGQLLIVHNIDDAVIPYQNALAVVDRLLDSGKQTWDLVSYPTGGHCSGARPQAQIDAFRRTFAMFEKHLKPAAGQHHKD